MRIDFLPSRHGFTFASTVALDEPRFGLPVPVAAAFGLSAGMGWAALDRYHAGRPIPCESAMPGADEPLSAELVQRQAAALARRGWAELRAWQRLPEHGWPWRPGVADRTRNEWRQLRRSLDAGQPVLLYVVLTRGRHADPSGNQAVLAYGYEIDRRSGRVSLRVYDPARPGNDGVRLVFRLGSRFRPLDARLAVQTVVRGFFCVPYDRPVLARVLHGDDGALDTRGSTSLVAVHGGQRPDGALHVFARSGEGRLLQIRRRRPGSWTVLPVDAAGKDIASIENAAVLAPGHLVLRTSAGELVEARRRAPLGWRARTISGRTVKTPFDAAPAVLRDRSGTVDVLACRGGRLLHFRRGKLNAWRTTHLKAGPLARATCTGSPAAACLDRSMLHVVARTETGELMHARWRGKQGWSGENVTARSGDRERFVLSDDPVLLADPRAGRLCIVARSRTGSVLLFRWSERSGWRAQDLTAGSQDTRGHALRSESPIAAALDRDGTVHAVGRTADRGLLHAWSTRDGAAGVQDVTHSRRTIGAAGEIDGTPRVLAGPEGSLHVFARRAADLLLYRWDGNADWSVENVSSEHGGPTLPLDPVITFAHGTAHVAALHEGKLHHVALATTRPAGATHLIAAWVGEAAALPVSVGLLLVDLVLLPGRGIVRAASMLRNHTAVSQDEVDVADATTERPVQRATRVDTRGHAVARAERDQPPAASPRQLLPEAAEPRASDVPEIAADELLDLPASVGAIEGEPVEDLPLLEDPTALLEESGGDAPAADEPETEANELPLLEPLSTDESWLEPWSGNTASVSPEAWKAGSASEPTEVGAELWNADPARESPETGAEPWSASLPESEPWAVSPVDDDSWNVTPAASADVPAPADHPAPADEPALVEKPASAEPIPAPDEQPEVAARTKGADGPVPAPTDLILVYPEAASPRRTEDTPTDAVAASAEDRPAPAPDVDEWNLPAMTTAADDWNAPTATVDRVDDADSAVPAAEAADDTGNRDIPAGLSDTPADEDWNLPAVAASAPAPTVGPRLAPESAKTDDWSFPPLDENEAAASEHARAPRKWTNPALEGLPLLDDDEPVGKPAAARPPRTPQPAPEPAARKKKKKKNEAADELQRVMALADQNRPELLPPS